MVKPKFEAVNNWCLLEDDIVAALQSFQCPLWVVGGHFAMRERCPLYPPKADVKTAGRAIVRRRSGRPAGS
jgi:hypothetical protein